MNKDVYFKRLAWARKVIAQKKQEGGNVVGLSEAKETINRRRKEGEK